MVANYSSFLEFVGAVYFTMSLTEFLKDRIWNPQDKKKFERVLDGLGMKDDNDFKDAVLDANKRKGEILQRELSKKSLIGLFVIAFLLLFCGYEQKYENMNAVDGLSLLQLELSYTCIYFLVTLFTLQWVLFDKWKYVVFYIASILVFFLLIRWRVWVFNCYEAESFMSNNIGLIVCATVSIPILWQIFITWLHKSVFYGYVKSKIREAQNDYNEVMEHLNKGDFDKVPHRYLEIYMRNSQAVGTSPQQVMDDTLTEYKGVLYNDVRVIGLNVRLYELLFSWIKYRGKGLIIWVINLFKSKGRSFVQANKLQVDNYAVYARKFQKLKEHNRCFNMVKFCQDEKISIVEFRNYYRKYCQSK